MNALGKIVALASVSFIAYKIYSAKNQTIENSKGNPVLPNNQVNPTTTTSIYKPSPLQPEFFGSANSAFQIPVTAPLSKKQQLTRWAARRYSDIAARTEIIKIIITRLNGIEVNTFYAWAITAGEDESKLGPNTRNDWHTLIEKYNIV